MSTRRSNDEWRARCTGDCGNSYSAPKTHAEIMNAPSRPASITYSGQCARSDSIAFSGGRCMNSTTGVGPETTGRNVGWVLIVPQSHALIRCASGCDAFKCGFVEVVRI